MALLNTLRHRRRTALNLFMIGGGVACIIIFEGFAANVLTSLRETTIQTQSGHIQIATRAYWNQDFERPREKLFPGYEAVLRKWITYPEVQFASGRISFFGLVSRGEKSLSAKGMSFDPAVEGSRSKAFSFTSGRALNAESPYHVAVGKGLAKRLGIGVGDSLTILSNTYDGMINAIDVEVGGVFATGISDFDNITFLISLKAAQTLLDTTQVETLVLGLKNTSMTGAVAQRIRKDPGGGDLEVRTWDTLATLYHQVASFNQVQNRVIALMILTLTLLAILNTVGMSIFERTGEIGTVLALGETQKSVITQFLLEGLVLGVLGSAVGLIIGVMGACLINLMGIQLMMPGASTYLTIKIDIVGEAFVWALLVSLLSSLFATFVPAFRASRMNIATALRHNI